MLRTRGVSSDEEKEGYGEKDLQKGRFKPGIKERAGDGL